MSSKPIIAVDIDEVLADGAEVFVQFSNEQWGTNLSVDDYQEHWAAMWQVDNVEVERRSEIWHQAGMLYGHGTKLDSERVLRSLKDRFELVITTSRRLSQKDGTLEWIAKNYSDIFSEVHFAGIFDGGLKDLRVYEHTKADLYREIGAAYTIDDQVKHCFAAAEDGVHALLFGDYNWNKVGGTLPANVVRCSDWAAVKSYFDKIA